MNENILHQVPENTKSPLDPDFDTYREIVQLVPQMQLSATSNPHRTVVAMPFLSADPNQPHIWTFAADDTHVFAKSPTNEIYVIDGVAALAVTALLQVARCADCAVEIQPHLAPYIPGPGHVCFDCLTYYVDRPIHLPDPEVAQ